jgi:hypothetical protein
MLQELDMDVANGTLYISPRLSQQGEKDYEALLRRALSSGDDVSLARDLRSGRRMRDTEPRRTPTGGSTMARVPVTAPDTLGEGEFNRFYARGLCARAVDDGISHVIVYRAKQVRNPRPESEAMIGKRLGAEALLQDLRTHPGVEPALGLPPGPNSGLSVKLP